MNTFLSNLRKTDGDRDYNLYCFSPQIMVLTFVLEFILALYVIVRYGLSTIAHRLIVLILLLLAAFQLGEYGICEQQGFNDLLWAKAGFVAITLLPALGIHLVQEIRRDSNRWPTYISYLLAALFSLTFMLENHFSAIGCDGNYAIFELNGAIGVAFASYYYALLLVAVALALQGYRSIKSHKRRTVLLATTYGYASFVVPATLIHFTFEDAALGLPSIMCGFAAIFALIMALFVAKHLPGSKA